MGGILPAGNGRMMEVLDADLAAEVLALWRVHREAKRFLRAFENYGSVAWIIGYCR